MCIWDSYVYQKGVLCFLIHKSYARSIKRYCFVRKYAAITVQLEIFILQYIGWLVLIIRTFIDNNNNNYYYYYMDVSCHRPFQPGTSLEPAVIPTAQASSFTLQYFPYYV